ncbi:MAG: hypothetical protein J6T52_13400 [Bacteroidaceae bacterium]|nr:hypothetical protein [Bacteroidaceae bacterium]
MTRIPHNYNPTVDEVKKYINKWNDLDNYVNQERALDYLFGDKCRYNNDIREVLIKCCTLNDFYSTNIFDIHSVAQHILKLNIDERLEKGDLSLVNDIAHVEVGNPKSHRFFYSFATKYCSHHQPEKYAIYDRYVEKLLMDFKKREDKFSKFTLKDLKNYERYMAVILDFQRYYGLTQFTLKQLDHYLWQLGKENYNFY